MSAHPLRCVGKSGQGFSLDPQFTRMPDGSVRYTSLLCAAEGMGSCFENTKLIFRFEGGGRLVLHSGSARNCNGNSWFDAGAEALQKLARPIKSICLVNGLRYQSVTYDLPPGDRGYFRVLQAALAQANSLALSDK